MTERIANLLKTIQVDRFPLCVEKSRLMTESFRKTDGEPMILRRAKALANVLQNITIFIEDHQLIAGNAASKPMGLEFDFYAGLWSREEIDSLRDAGYLFSKKEQAELAKMNDYWKAFNPISRMGGIFSDRLWPFMQSGMILPPWKDRETGPGGGYAESGMGLGPGFYILTVDFEKVLKKGLNSVIKDAESALQSTNAASPDFLERIAYLKAVIIAHKSIIHFARRFADLARETAAATSDPERRKELKRIAEICAHVPANPARTFYEALQSFWFIFLMTTPSPTASMGRFDQYMIDFYKKDLENKIITDEDVLELLQCLRIKDMHLNRTSGKAARQKNAGMAKWHNMTIGGVQPATGEDATNALSYLILEAIERCPVPHHTVTVRVHENTPEKLMLKALEVVRIGIGMPAFVGDRSYIEYLLSEKVALRDARNFSLGGCIDATIAGKSRIAAYGMFIVPKILEITLNNGVDPRTGVRLGLTTGEFNTFETFENFLNAFKKQLRYFMELHAEKNNIELQVYRELFPDPVRSSLMDNGVEMGKALMDRVFPFENIAVLNPVGMINVVDSLAAIKQIVFDQKKIGGQEMLDALNSNWAGVKGEKLRKLFLAAPKYGNNIDAADTVAKDVFDFFAKTAVQFKTYLGGTHKPTGVSISAQWPGGALTGATPDGRCDGECLADGTVSAMRGMDLNGPTAVLNSAAKIDQIPYQASLLNMKFHPSSLKTDQDLRKLSFLIRTYFSRNGKHIQFNVVNRKVLTDAQENPERHQDLIVRIAGYSAYFTQLGKPMQNEIIGRTEHEGIA
ncbi:MAG: formate C-acetyltransferase [Deltaproteobacteria bacterium]|jgi:pyruvate formate-lyase/glycerol dehydratase family glycyl radical enzyme|nr:formate C-acetyltransferase [Deltaproteobacteria bacterium]